MPIKTCQETLIKQMLDSFLFNLSRTGNSWTTTPEITLDSEILESSLLEQSTFAFIPPDFYLRGQTSQQKRQRISLHR